MTAPTRPVYPLPFADAMRGLPTLHAVGNVALSDLSMRCLARAYYGGFFRAAIALAKAGVADRWMTACVRVRLAWYRALGLTEEQIDRRFS